MKKYIAYLVLCVLLFGMAPFVAAEETIVYTNVALNKPVTSGRWHNALPKTYINDGDLDTFTYCDGTNTDNEDGSLSDASENWYLFDLGAKYNIEYVKLIDNTNTWTSGYNVKILASNDKKFENGVYEIINSGVDGNIPMGENITCASDEAYRYVKIQKFVGTVHPGYQYSEFEVYASAEDIVRIPNIALNKPVTSGRWHNALPKTYINDGDLDTFTYCDGTNTDNENGVVSEASENWYIFDLGAEYKIDYVKLSDNTNTWTSGYNVKILASNDKKFENGVYEIINSGVDGNIPMGENITCASDESYRYIKIQKFVGTVHPGYQYSEFEVYPKGINVNGWALNTAKDGSGSEFTNLEDVSVGGVKASIANYSENVIKAAAVAALYDKGGKLIATDVNIKEIKAGKKSEISVGIDIPTDANIGSYFKGFLWNVTNGAAMPFAEPKFAELHEKHSIYVAENGSDDGDGTLYNPYKTLEKAKTAVKELKRSFDGNIDVYLRGGVYPLKDTLTFDETDGGKNYTTYTAYNGEDVTISGGKKITGWEGFDGNIVRAKFDSENTIRELYVNGKKATRAISEKPVRSNDYYYENGKCAGLVVPGLNASNYVNEENIQLKFDIAYRTMIMNIESVFALGDSTVFKMHGPQFAAIASDVAGYRGITKSNAFYIENAYKELDEPGEFYYNKSEGYIYYMTNGEQVEEAYVPILENLIEVSGSDSLNKVHNIRFKNLKFAHTSDNSVSENGLIADQAQRIITVDDNGNQNYEMRDAAIKLKKCDGIEFSDNSFTGIAKVCLGLYEGTSNSVITGNAFYDTGDSAITVGSPDEAYLDTPHTGRNLALRRPTTGTSVGTAAAVDGNAYSGWSLDVNDCADGNYKNGYLQIDLGDAYVINRIEVDARKGYDQPTTRANFEVVASNDPDFASGNSIIARQGGTAFASEGTWSQKVSNRKAYRYIRVRKTANEYFYIADIRVINTSMVQNEIKEVCKNNSICGNVITRIGDVNHSAPAIVAYYTEESEIKQNHIYDVPYTGISSGWGWTNYPDSVTNKNNNIEANIVERYCLKCIDGAGIYTLGNQPGCTVRENIIRNQVNAHGAIYPDDGTVGLAINENIIENSCTWLFIWSDNKKNITATNNYTSAPRYVNAGTNCTVGNTTYIIPGKYDGRTWEIYNNAGPKNNAAAKVPTDTKIYDFEDFYTNVIYNSGMNASTIAGYYLSPTILEAESVYELHKLNCGADAAETFRNAIEKAKNVNSSDSRVIIEAQLELKEAREIFVNSGK